MGHWSCEFQTSMLSRCSDFGDRFRTGSALAQELVVYSSLGLALRGFNWVQSFTIGEY